MVVQLTVFVAEKKKRAMWHGTAEGDCAGAERIDVRRFFPEWRAGGEEKEDCWLFCFVLFWIDRKFGRGVRCLKNNFCFCSLRARLCAEQGQASCFKAT